LGKLSQILAQTFTYLDECSRMKVYESADGLYILKLFKDPKGIVAQFKSWKVDLGALPEAPVPGDDLATAKVLRERTIDSCKLAMESLSLETGLIHLQLEPLETSLVVVLDRREIDLKNQPFLLQKKARLIEEDIYEALKIKDFAKAKSTIDKLVSFVFAMWAKGFTEDTYNFRNNYGTIDGAMALIDVGELHREPDKVAFEHADLKILKKESFMWLSQIWPELAVYLKAEVLARSGAKAFGSPRVSIVICTYGKAAFLDEVLEGIAEQSYKNFEVIVVDNNPQPLCQTQNGYRVLHCAAPGLSAARNFGIVHTDSDIVAFLDDDAIPDKKWLEKMVQGFELYSCDMAGGTVSLHLEREPKWLSPKVRAYLSELLYKGEDIGELVPPRYIVGANMALTREAITKYGLFEDGAGRMGAKLISSEDSEMTRRIANAGGRISFIAKSKVVHMIPASRTSFSYLAKRAWWQGISDALLDRLEPLPRAKRRKLPHFGMFMLLESIRAVSRTGYNLGLLKK
jgi:GT2 family glycosyltransferase